MVVYHGSYKSTSTKTLKEAHSKYKMLQLPKHMELGKTHARIATQEVPWDASGIDEMD